MVASNGTGYCTSAARATALMLSNVVQVATVHWIAAMIMWLAKVCVFVCVCLFVCVCVCVCVFVCMCVCVCERERESSEGVCVYWCVQVCTYALFMCAHAHTSMYINTVHTYPPNNTHIGWYCCRLCCCCYGRV